MNGFSLNPDPSMRWIYNQNNPDYYTDQAEQLREARAAALRSCPRWMLEQAFINDTTNQSTNEQKMTDFEQLKHKGE